jgi:hypothetical protein
MKHKQLQERIDKINLFKEISKGRKSLSELTPETVRFWYHKVDGSYSSGELKLTRAQFEQYSEAHPRQRNIIYTLQEGNEPIIDDEE